RAMLSQVTGLLQRKSNQANPPRSLTIPSVHRQQSVPLSKGLNPRWACGEVTHRPPNTGWARQSSLRESP
ncbi:hypothetical protein KUCAC02_020221, partial [Chaenocephalus aceratus]